VSRINLLMLKSRIVSRIAGPVIRLFEKHTDFYTCLAGFVAGLIISGLLILLDGSRLPGTPNKMQLFFPVFLGVTTDTTGYSP
jgi:hypothetical protein